MVEKLREMVQALEWLDNGGIKHYQLTLPILHSSEVLLTIPMEKNRYRERIRSLLVALIEEAQDEATSLYQPDK